MHFVRPLMNADFTCMQHARSFYRRRTRAEAARVVFYYAIFFRAHSGMPLYLKFFDEVTKMY